jgi:hypothetical protein
MIILVTGDRNWTDYDTVAEVLSRAIPGQDTLIEGGAPGLDTIAGEIALGYNLILDERLAKWDQYGRAAGPIRNKEMLDLKPDVIFAFHNDFAHSKGTKNCVNQAKKLGYRVEMVTSGWTWDRQLELEMEV